MCEVILNLGQWFRRCGLKKKFRDKDRSRKLTLSLWLRYVKNVFPSLEIVM